MSGPKKSLGQHFLTNEHTAERIAAAVNSEANTIVEVGPGPGILTHHLLERDAVLCFIEKDDRYARALAEATVDRERVSVIHQDFLKVNLAQVTRDTNTSLVGNFPYNISSQIVFRMLKYRDLFTEMVGMFQLEMARRIVASPGGKDYGVISVLTQASYTGKIIMKVSPGQFNPPPKVKSAVIQLHRKEDFEPPCDYRWLRKVVKAAFNQRRKMLRNSLKPYFTPEIMANFPIFTQRPEQLDLPAFYELARLAEKENTLS